MNAAEHYAEAERLIELDREDGGWAPDGSANMTYLAAAQVHATLALVAARYTLTNDMRRAVASDEDAAS